MIDLKYQLVYRTLLRFLAEKRRPCLSCLSEATGLPEAVIVEALRHLSVDLDELSVTDLVIAAWRRGFNVVDMAIEMGWRDLEALCGAIFREAGFEVSHNLRFKHGGRRFEVDVVAVRGDLILVVDCKRWSRARRSKLLEAAEEQKRRAEAFAAALQSLPLPIRSGRYRVCPLVVSLFGVRERMHEKVPVVSLYELRGFLSEFEAFLPEVCCYSGFKNSIV